MVAFRTLAGTWALGSFLLVNYYNSILTSFFAASNYKLLMNSVYELPKNPEIKVTANSISAPVFFFRLQVILIIIQNQYDGYESFHLNHRMQNKELVII